MHLWSISNHADLSGAGGLGAGGRWHSAGHAIIYCGTSPAACLLEALIHVSVRRPEELPLHYQLLAIDLPANIAAAPPARASP
jgi:RES domain-containing protein